MSTRRPSSKGSSGPRTNRSTKKSDKFGYELADDARIWTIYRDVARGYDDELLRGWNSSLDTLLIFAGLFSAVVTAFIVESYKLLQPDYTELTFRALVGQPTNVPVDRDPARVVNCLWIASLFLSLITALVAILAKQWLAEYPLRSHDNLRQWAELRQTRHDSLTRWHVPEVIALVPVLLHIALLLFLAGFVVFLSGIDSPSMLVALVLAVATGALYVFATLSPVVWSTSPLRTHLTPMLRRLSLLFLWIFRISILPDEWATIPEVRTMRGIAAAMSWLGTRSTTSDIYYAVLGALGDLTIGPFIFKQTSHILRERVLSELVSTHPGALSLASAMCYFRVVLHNPQVRDSMVLYADAISSSDPSEWRSGEIGETVVLAACYSSTSFYDLGDWRVSVLSGVHVSAVTAGLVVRSIYDDLRRRLTRDPWQKEMRQIIQPLCGWQKHFIANPNDMNALLRLVLPEAHHTDINMAPLCTGSIFQCQTIEVLAVVIRFMARDEFAGPRQQAIDLLFAFCAAHPAGNHPSLLHLFSDEPQVLWTPQTVGAVLDQISLDQPAFKLTARPLLLVLRNMLTSRTSAWHTGPVIPEHLPAARRCLQFLDRFTFHYTTHPLPVDAPLQSLLEPLFAILTEAPLALLSTDDDDDDGALVAQIISNTIGLAQQIVSEDNSRYTLLRPLISARQVAADINIYGRRWDLASFAVRRIVDEVKRQNTWNPYDSTIASSLMTLSDMLPNEHCGATVGASIQQVVRDPGFLRYHKITDAAVWGLEQFFRRVSLSEQ